MLIFEYEHKNFIHSIRSFDEGVKLAGRAAHLIPWPDIHRIHFNEKKVEFLLQNDIKAFRVDQRDLKEMEAIIAVWNEKKQIVLRK